MFHGELAPIGGILGPLKSDLGVFWSKIPLYPYNVKTQKTHFLKILEWADFDLLESNCRHIFLTKNQKIYHSQFFFSWYIFSSQVKSPQSLICHRRSLYTIWHRRIRFWSISHWNSHWSRKILRTAEGRVVHQKQNLFWKSETKWNNLKPCKSWNSKFHQNKNYLIIII